MLLHRRLWVFLVGACLSVVIVGCSSRSEQKPKKSEPAQTGMLMEEKDIASPAAKSESMPEHHSKPAATKEKPRQAIAPEVIPKVVLSGEDRATCLVDVGDTLPAANLPDLNGKMHTLESLYGPKLTVVCFWTMGTHRDQLVADEALSDLAQEVAASFGPKGVAVVAIDVGDPADAVAKELSQTGATFPCLRDPNGGYFGKIAKGDQMPRTFLLDAGGRILWFDIEYSRPSRRELLRCIQVAFGKL